jgi:hypothetical protein
MKAADVMTRAVITATPRTSVAERAQLMLQHRISGILLTALAWLSGLLQGRLAAPDENWHGFAISTVVVAAERSRPSRARLRQSKCAYHWRNFDRGCRFRNIACRVSGSV